MRPCLASEQEITAKPAQQFFPPREFIRVSVIVNHICVLLCFAAALQHAGKHMEDSIVASYTALLLGCLCQGSQVRISNACAF